MKTSKEIRGLAWDALFKGGWFGRLTAAMLLMAGISLLSATLLQSALSLLDGGAPLLDWNRVVSCQDTEELWAYIGAPAILTRLVAMAALMLLLSLVLNGLYHFGMARLELRAAGFPRPRGGWVRHFLGGVTMPLGLAWFYVCWYLRVWWLTLLVVAPCYGAFCVSTAAGQPQPGYLLALPLLAFSLMNFYRYRQAWYLKTAHPDWSVSVCLRESRRLTDGRKARNFALDCSYWRPFTLLLLLLFLLVAFSLFSPLLAAAVQLGAMLLTWGAAAYFGVGQAVFHRELLAADPPADPTGRADS